MIVKMHRYAFLVFHAEYAHFVEELKELGVLHIEETGEEPAGAAQEKMRLLADLRKLIGNLEQRAVYKVPPHPALPDQGGELFAHIRSVQNRIEMLEQHQSVLEKERNQFEAWGNFSWESVTQLNEVDIETRFFQCASSKYQVEWEKLYPLATVSDAHNILSFVLFQPEGQPLPDLDAEEVKLPLKSLSGIVHELKDLDLELTMAQDLMDGYAHYGVKALKQHAAEIHNELQSEMAHLHTRAVAEGAVCHIQGFVSQPRQKELNQWLANQGVVYASTEAKQEDRPPILLHNGPFARLFEPIGKLFALPDYMELDLTPFFAPFFLLFFGFCLGDAGYGVLFVLAATIARFKVKKDFVPYLVLLQWLGLSTVAFGMLTGTLFGLKLTQLEVPWMSGMKELMFDDNQMFNLALGFGFVQIIFGMVLKGINQTIQNGIAYSLSTWGWILVIVSSAIGFALDQLMAPWHLAVVALAALGIFIFNNPKRNVLMNVGAGLWDTYNMVTGFAGDILSYIRLFALGLSSGILGLVFNKLAFDLSPDVPVLNVIVTAIILIVGHGLNIFMSALGSFVHPMRLTFVEFFKNAGFLGGGKGYSPLKKVEI